MVKDNNLALIATVAIVGCVVTIAIFALFLSINSMPSRMYYADEAMVGQAIGGMPVETLTVCVKACDYIKQISDDPSEADWRLCFADCISTEDTE